jgi:hypothetical protein
MSEMRCRFDKLWYGFVGYVYLTRRASPISNVRRPFAAREIDPGVQDGRTLTQTAGKRQNSPQSATLARFRRCSKPGAQNVVVGSGDRDGIRVGAFREQDAGGGEERRLIITLVRPGAILSACGVALLVRGSGSAALWLINLQFRQSVTVPGPRGANCV